MGFLVRISYQCHGNRRIIVTGCGGVLVPDVLHIAGTVTSFVTFWARNAAGVLPVAIPPDFLDVIHHIQNGHLTHTCVRRQK